MNDFACAHFALKPINRYKCFTVYTVSSVKRMIIEGSLSASQMKAYWLLKSELLIFYVILSLNHCKIKMGFPLDCRGYVSIEILP